MSQSLNTYLKQHGHSLTRARSLVFSALSSHEPLTMHELVHHCPTIDRASVYRCVSLYERLGIVERLHTGWKYRLELSDIFQEHHHHATCLACGTSLRLDESAKLERELQLLAQRATFHIERHQIELQGYCADCHK